MWGNVTCISAKKKRLGLGVHSCYSWCVIFVKKETVQPFIGPSRDMAFLKSLIKRMFQYHSKLHILSLKDIVLYVCLTQHTPLWLTRYGLLNLCSFVQGKEYLGSLTLACSHHGFRTWTLILEYVCKLKVFNLHTHWIVH
jgi:hypothetical protein